MAEMNSLARKVRLLKAGTITVFFTLSLWILHSLLETPFRSLFALLLILSSLTYILALKVHLTRLVTFSWLLLSSLFLLSMILTERAADPLLLYPALSLLILLMEGVHTLEFLTPISQQPLRKRDSSLIVGALRKHFSRTLAVATAAPLLGVSLLHIFSTSPLHPEPLLGILLFSMAALLIATTLVFTQEQLLQGVRRLLRLVGG